jgi:hypothetical protein
MEPLFDKLSRHIRVGRFIVVALLVLFVGYVAIPCIEYGFLNFGDSDLPPFQPDTTFEKICDGIWLTVIFPFSAVGFLFGKIGINPPGFIWCFLFISPGLFWAYMVEVILRARRRYVA